MSRLVFEDLVLEYEVEEGAVRCVDGVQLQVPEGKVTALIGESGSGKTTLSNAVLRLLAPNARVRRGRILVDGVDVLGLSPEEVRRFRWHRASLVFQAAQSAFNPTLTLGEQLRDAVADHGQDPEQAPFPERIRELLGMVRLDPARVLPAWPHQLSGGMRQRVAIAMALVTSPDLIVLDEPTSALDMLTQANIMNVLKGIKQETDASFMLITHDIATSSELADRVAVMYAGQIVERNDAASFYREPLHPYARALMASVPRLRADREPEFITGQPPSLLDPPPGCRFAERCAARFARCVEDPPLFPAGSADVRCWLYAKSAALQEGA